MLTVCMWMRHLLSWYSFVKACLSWTCLFAMRNVRLFIRSATEAHLSFSCFLQTCFSNALKTFSLLNIICWNSEKAINKTAWSWRRNLLNATSLIYKACFSTCTALQEGCSRRESIMSSRLRLKQLASPALMRFTAYFRILNTTLISSANHRPNVSFLYPPMGPCSYFLHSHLTYSTFSLSVSMCEMVVKALFLSATIWFKNRGLNMKWALI